MSITWRHFPYLENLFPNQDVPFPVEDANPYHKFTISDLGFRFYGVKAWEFEYTIVSSNPVIKDVNRGGTYQGKFQISGAATQQSQLGTPLIAGTKIINFQSIRTNAQEQASGFLGSGSLLINYAFNGGVAIKDEAFYSALAVSCTYISLTGGPPVGIVFTSQTGGASEPPLTNQQIGMLSWLDRQQKVYGGTVDDTQVQLKLSVKETW